MLFRSSLFGGEWRLYMVQPGLNAGSIDGDDQTVYQGGCGSNDTPPEPGTSDALRRERSELDKWATVSGWTYPNSGGLEGEPK